MLLENILPIVRQHARRIARRWHDTVIDHEDLYQEGAIMALLILRKGIPDQPEAITYAYLHKRIAGRMLDVLKLSRGRTVDKRTESIDDMSAYDQEAIMKYMVSTDDPESVCAAKEAIDRIGMCLRHREAAIVEMTIDGCSGVQIANRLCVDPGRISQIFNGQIRPKILSAMS